RFPPPVLALRSLHGRRLRGTLPPAHRTADRPAHRGPPPCALAPVLARGSHALLHRSRARPTCHRRRRRQRIRRLGRRHPPQCSHPPGRRGRVGALRRLTPRGTPSARRSERMPPSRSGCTLRTQAALASRVLTATSHTTGRISVSSMWRRRGGSCAIDPDLLAA